MTKRIIVYLLVLPIKHLNDYKDNFDNIYYLKDLIFGHYIHRYRGN